MMRSAEPFADLADRSPVRQPFDARDHGGALSLGAPIELPDPFGAEPLDPFFLQPGRHRRGHVEHDLEAR